MMLASTSGTSAIRANKSSVGPSSLFKNSFISPHGQKALRTRSPPVYVLLAFVAPDIEPRLLSMLQSKQEEPSSSTFNHQLRYAATKADGD
jgi:hypothetical protein